MFSEERNPACAIEESNSETKEIKNEAHEALTIARGIEESKAEAKATNPKKPEITDTEDRQAILSKKETQAPSHRIAENPSFFFLPDRSLIPQASPFWNPYFGSPFPPFLPPSGTVPLMPNVFSLQSPSTLHIPRLLQPGL